MGGDYNICATAADSHHGSDGDGEIFHTIEEREVLTKLFDLGLTDLFRDKYPDSDAFSWWDYRAGAFQRNHGLRIDLLLGTEGVVDRTNRRGYRSRLQEETGRSYGVGSRTRVR